jgi:hypothetical protein
MPVVFEDDAARPGHGAPIDHHVAGQDQARFAIRPGLVKPHQWLRRRLIGVGHVFFHRGLGDPVGNHRAVGQRQLLKHVHGTLFRGALFGAYLA